ncbi:hypothetical protein K4K54_008012 [Colletotrichum sp. SAR 10_86]|nr:hypothetical protein K4K50_006107 [Colletotrichum sp. SAR 10_71]KAI8221179.1 hypothetical protein K4K54_008012 [Colletotrichum sp. SAR 10_86]
MVSSHFESEFATDKETRWCLRCLKWYAGKSKNKRGQECQELDFTCSGASGEDRCERCAKSLRRSGFAPKMSSLVVAQSWSCASFIPTQILARTAVVRALAAVQSGTENYYSRLEKNDDMDDDSDSNDAHEHDVRTGSLPADADTRPRRSVPTVNYSRSALYPAETLKAFRSAGKDRVSSKTSASNPAAAPIPRPVRRQTPILPSAGPAEPVPAGSAVLDPGGIAGALAVSRHATPAPAAPMANPDRFARVVEAIGEVSRLTAARNEAINRLGEAFFDAFVPGEPAPVARLSNDQVQDVLRMLGQAGGNVGNE